MKSVKILDNKLLVTFKTKDRNEFYNILNVIKNIETLQRRYDPNIKAWIINNNDDNINILNNLGFDIETPKLSTVYGTIFNNQVELTSTIDSLMLIKEFFSYDDYSYCYVNGKFDKRKIKKVSIVEINKNADDVASLPIGFLQDFIYFLEQNNIKLELKELRKFKEYNFTNEQIKSNLHYLQLYDYQIEAVRACIENKTGIIKLPTSAGKSEIFLSLCNLLNIKTLILFNRIGLAEQTLERALKANLDTGIVQGNNIDENHLINMATIQSVHKLESNYEMIICDECHGCQSTKYQEFLQRKDFKYRFGFSATPFTKDKYKNALVQKYTGSIIYTLEAEVLIDMGKIAKPIINIIEINYPKKLQDLNWQQAEKFGIIKNEYRNNTIIELVNKIKGATLILVKKIKHGKLLENKINNAIFLSGNTDIETRKEICNKFENDEKITIIASTIFDEGISLNNIKNLIIAGGGKSEIKTLQRIGRGLRIKEGKTTVNIFDFVDNTNYFLQRHSNERIKTYKNEGFTDIQEYKM